MPKIPGLIDSAQFLAMVGQKSDPKSEGSKKGNKFGATPLRNGHDQFDSKHEASWGFKLTQLQRVGYLTNLEMDKRALKFALDVNGVRIADYEADAKFEVVKAFDLSGLAGVYHLRDGEQVVIDAKSPPTRKKRDYVLKKNLMFALYKIRILEV
ncbi:hypothetical protein EON80_10775 [bacterium]|nr:MAG: hypothetical protein EON80_10775 [bacterium]